MQAEQFTPEEHAADPLRDAAPVSQKRFEAYCKSMDEWVKVQERRPDTKVDIGAFQQYQKFVRDQFAMQHHRVEHLAKRVTALETKQPQTY
jgi:hypothetical protein